MDSKRLEYSESYRSGRARTGRLATRRGVVDTPAFMPVGTLGTVKSLLPEEVREAGAQIILGNTYHLILRPGTAVMKTLGGLHRFMDWDGPILTDSGGFQVFSLAGMRKLDEDGVTFRSHIDGKLMYLTPELCVEAQEALGSDIMMVLDECPPAGAGRDYLEKSLARDHRWAGRALAARTPEGGALMGIVQGGIHADLRARSVELLAGLDMDGYALGGLSVGEPKEEMYRVLEETIPLLPEDRPVYLMGVGDPSDLVRGVGLGVDMFDCVMPTRMARNGTLLAPWGRMNLMNARYASDPLPPDPDCVCPTCRRFTRAYLRHLFQARELLGYRLATIHNLHYILGLMAGLRRAIAQNAYDAFARNFFTVLERGGGEGAVQN